MTCIAGSHVESYRRGRPDLQSVSAEGSSGTAGFLSQETLEDGRESASAAEPFNVKSVWQCDRGTNNCQPDTAGGLCDRVSEC